MHIISMRLIKRGRSIPKKEETCFSDMQIQYQFIIKVVQEKKIFILLNKHWDKLFCHQILGGELNV